MENTDYRILWKGQISGPFTREQVETMLMKNEIGVWAEVSEGNSDWKPISEWRIRKPAFQAAPKHEGGRPSPSVSPKLNVAPSASKQEDVPDLPPLPKSSMSGGSHSNVRVRGSAGESRGGFFYWAFLPFRKYGVFAGRARRKEYWLYTLLVALIYGVIGFFEGYLEYGSASEQAMLDYVYMVDAIFALILLVPNMAVLVRRLHDTNRSGWWVLIGLTGIGLLVLLLFALQEGTDGENEYG